MGLMDVTPDSAASLQRNAGIHLDQFENGSDFYADLDAHTQEVVSSMHLDLSAEDPAVHSAEPRDTILEESGRKLHAYEQGKYFLPSDSSEQDRLDRQHITIAKLLGRLSFAHISEPLRYVLDVGTGTGIWALNFAEEHPTTHVIGTDLNPIPSHHRNFANCEFIVADSENEWDFRSIKFDYIHLRMVFTCFDNPKRVIDLAYKNLQPGGWIEYQDSIFQPERLGGTAEGTALQRWCDHCIQGAALARGRDITPTPHLKDWLIEAGFEIVEEKKYIWPLSPWPSDSRMREVGWYNMSNMLDGLQSVGSKMLKAAGLSTPEIKQLTDDARREVEDTTNRFYWTVYVVYGRKPLVPGSIN
ncbi:S-adenosyl-L-methionine-dependent methyltransferase [Xylariales sp. PMI_506]|nr:S-adenosyl-L-methionine-dependent methyltransferase [Xylariales sp. PMI_506]